MCVGRQVVGIVAAPDCELVSAEIAEIFAEIFYATLGTLFDSDCESLEPSGDFSGGHSVVTLHESFRLKLIHASSLHSSTALKIT